MSKKALVTFTPFDPYFFGSELTHGSGEGANYFSKGNPLPQQTTLCGALRHLLLSRGFSRGTHSFTPEDSKLNDYGDLLGLSPLFLSNGKEFFLRQAIDQHDDHAQFALSPEKANEWMLFDTGSNKDVQPTWQNARSWKDYDPKKDLADCWVSPEGSSKKPDEIFKVFIRPGIPKKELRRPKPNGPGLFKQQLYRLEKNWAFCVLAEFADSVDLTKLDNFTLPMGGEKTVFHISVKDETRKFEEVFPQEKMFYRDEKTDEPRLVLTSDAWVTDDLWQHTTAAVTETVDFRHIRTHVNVERFGRLRSWTPNDNTDPIDQLAKSGKYTLLRRGTVLVTEAKNLPDLKKALSVEHWRTIGYNHFFTYP